MEALVSDNLRSWFSSQIKPLLPSGWRYIPNQKTPETVTVPTLVFKLMELEPLPEAPRGSLSAGIVLTLICPLVDDVKAEDALDDDVLALMTALDGHRHISWKSARKVRDSVTDRLSWDLNVSAITTRPIREK